MKARLLLLLGCFAALSGAALAMQSQRLHREAHQGLLGQMRAAPELHFKQWVQQHAKPYLEDAAVFAHRFKAWLQNLEYVLEYNARQTSHWLGMTSLADLTTEEYRAKLGFDGARHKRLQAMKRASNKLSSFKYADVDPDSLPKSIDWRTQQAVTEVKNQQQCGSCWAFSATGAMEGVNAIVTKELLSLSEQELVDCDTREDHGCQGGLMDNAFQFVMENKGLDTEDDYPYTAMNGECSARHKKHRVVTIDGFEDVPENDNTALKKAVAHQPVAVAIEADQKAFQLYMGGVFADETCGTQLDHGVLVVGYGMDSKEGLYWIVKNSWGAEWGEHGYIRLKANVEQKEGMCGIAMAASYPTKTGPNPPKPGPDPPEPPPTPKPPKPEPVDCDDTSSCPAATTCCCVTELFNMCLQWGCCPMEAATCCADKQHCCPHDLPVCDTKGGRCLPRAGQYAGAQPWLNRTPATRDMHALHNWWMRGKKTA